MRKLLTVLLMAGCAAAAAENLQLKNGSVLKNVTIISADPEQLLIVHDGGVCQVRYAELKPDSLTPAQRAQVEQLLKKHVARRERLEELRIEKEAFEKAQLEKGLVLFEGNWMSPEDRQKILTLRETARLERERMKLALETEKLKLKQAELKAVKGDRLFGAQETRSSFITYTGRSWPTLGENGWYYYHGRYCPMPSPYRGLHGTYRSPGGSISIRLR